MYWALSYYSDLTLSQEFQPMAAQLSMKAALPLAKILATASCRSSKTGPWIVMCRTLPSKVIHKSGFVYIEGRVLGRFIYHLIMKLGDHNINDGRYFCTLLYY